MEFSQIRVGDMITEVNGFRLNTPRAVIEVVPEGTKIRLATDRIGIGHCLYHDHHEVEVERHLNSEAFVIISDALLLMAERLEREGHSSTGTRVVMEEWHRFSSPDTDTQIILRPSTP